MNKLAFVCTDVPSQTEYRGWFVFGLGEGSRLIISVFSVLKCPVSEGMSLPLGSGLTEVELFSLRASLLYALQEKINEDWGFFEKNPQSLHCEFKTQPIPSQKPVTHIR